MWDNLSHYPDSRRLGVGCYVNNYSLKPFFS